MLPPNWPDTGPRDCNLNRWLRELEEKLIDVAEAEGSGVSLLGWSLSGIYARRQLALLRRWRSAPEMLD